MYGNDRKASSIILSISRMFENVSVLSWENVFDWVFKLLFFCFMPFPVWLCFVMYLLVLCHLLEESVKIRFQVNLFNNFPLPRY